jgi:hypothetical protein
MSGQRPGKIVDVDIDKLILYITAETVPSPYTFMASFNQRTSSHPPPATSNNFSSIFGQIQPPQAFRLGYGRRLVSLLYMLLKLVAGLPTD